MNNAASRLLRAKIEDQRTHVDQWKFPSEARLFETVRAIDFLFFEELFQLPGWKNPEAPRRLISSMGINNALARMIPESFELNSVFRLVRSQEATQSPADEFLLQCGALARAEHLADWLDEGLLDATLRDSAYGSPLIKTILTLRPKSRSAFASMVAIEHSNWRSDLSMKVDEPWEQDLKIRHERLAPEFERVVGEYGNWGIRYSTTPEIDQHFLECGQLYLRRMTTGDLLGPEDIIGGNQFNEYLGVLAALAGRAQKHLCFAAILARRNKALDLRNLLTTFAPYDEFLVGLAHFLDADRLHVQKLLSSLILDPSNRDLHTSSGETAWAPVIRSSQNHCILPLFGLEFNPYHFLLKDLEAKYPKDWFRAANNRERRWLKELKYLFPEPKWAVHDRNLKLKDGGKVLTDLDFMAFNHRENELALFQLKWQHAVGGDDRRRRSAGKNLIEEGNKWIETTAAWIQKHGLEELGLRSGLRLRSDTQVVMFVVGRYQSMFAGYESRDDRGNWLDWNHFIKLRSENSNASMTSLAAQARSDQAEILTSYTGDFYAIPVRDLTVIVQPNDSF